MYTKKTVKVKIKKPQTLLRFVKMSSYWSLPLKLLKLNYYETKSSELCNTFSDKNMRQNFCFRETYLRTPLGSRAIKEHPLRNKMILWAFSMSTFGIGMYFSHIVNLGRRESNKMKYDSNHSDVTEKNKTIRCFKHEPSIKRRPQRSKIQPLPTKTLRKMVNNWQRRLTGAARAYS